MHGGLPMVDGVVLDDIRKLSRECEPGEQGDFCQNFWNFFEIFLKKFWFFEPKFSGTLTDLLWADPQDEAGRGMSKRGTSMQFGPDVTEKFCKQNGLDYM